MTQTWNPETYARDARFVSDLGAPVLDLLAPQPGERILDLGCGDGVLTAKLQSIGCDVLGVDASAAQVEATKKLGVPAQTIDGENLNFENEFDAVFSNAALHWMRNNPDAVISGVHRALRPGARFVAEMGGARCVEKIRTALIAALDRRNIDGKSADLWFFPTVEDYSAAPHTRRLRHRLHRSHPAPHAYCPATSSPGSASSPTISPTNSPHPIAKPTSPKSSKPSARNSATPTRQMDRRLHPPPLQSDKD